MNSSDLCFTFGSSLLTLAIITIKKQCKKLVADKQNACAMLAFPHISVASLIVTETSNVFFRKVYKVKPIGTKQVTIIYSI